MKRIGIIIGCCLAVLTALFTLVNPNAIPAILLILPFVLLFVMLWVLSYAVFTYKHMRKAKAIRLSGLTAAVPVLCLVLQSIGQLTIRDVVTLGAVLAISYFYLSRLSNTSQ